MLPLLPVDCFPAAAAREPSVFHFIFKVIPYSTSFSK
jgi:hypothetical protein